ncbi:MAG TPA: glycosyltransferase family 2 protein [Thermoleophilaceae bacterium]|nr:glycosyltransferase family 2 protein [Thermoleophilaceae bacterium]
MADPVRPTLSVIVVTYNERELVERSLPPLVAQLADGDELIVADNRSTDGSPEAVRRLAPAATVIEMPANDGYMPAANAAAARARGDLLLTLDVDAVVEPGFCDAIRRPAVDGRGWALWMGLVTMDRGRLVNTSGGVLHYTGIGWAGQAGEPVERAPETAREVGFATGVCLTIPRATWEEHPGFPPDYFLYCDDVDYSLRVRLSGGTVGVEPSARVDHLYDFAKGARKWRLLERNRWATIVRTYPRELLVLLAPALVATELALLAVAFAGGWGPEKLASWGDLARSAPRLLRDRRAIQSHRRVSALDFARHMTPDLSSPYLGRASRARWLRAALRAYWRLVLAVLR